VQHDRADGLVAVVGGGDRAVINVDPAGPGGGVVVGVVAQLQVHADRTGQVPDVDRGEGRVAALVADVERVGGRARDVERGGPAVGRDRRADRLEAGELDVVVGD